MNADKMKRKFEAYAKDRGWSVVRENDEYVDSRARLGWGAWLAACTCCVLDFTEGLAELTAYTAKDLSA